MHRFAAMIFLSVFALAPASMAQSLGEAAERTVACLDLEGAEARLACLEAGAADLSAALERGAPAAPAAPAVPASPSEPDWAAAPAPKPEPETEEDRTPIWARVLPREDPDAVDSIEVSVTRILRNKAGRHFFMTADGQEWEQTVVEIVRPPESLPAEATIRESLMGSPTLVFEDGPSGAYKVRRVK